MTFFPRYEPESLGIRGPYEYQCQRIPAFSNEKMTLFLSFCSTLAETREAKFWECSQNSKVFQKSWLKDYGFPTYSEESFIIGIPEKKPGDFGKVSG